MTSVSETSQLGDAPMVMHVTQTSFNGGGSPDLLRAMPDVAFHKSDPPPASVGALVLDRSAKFQTMLGFGGAFTEAAAVNWMKLSKEDRAKVIHLYYGDPKDGGHGYTMGRVPMGSCDFTRESYSFDNTSGDIDMA